MNEESILLDVKKLLGIPKEQAYFDTDVIIAINTTVANLVQMGIGPSDGFVITGEEETWKDFVGENKLITQIKSYVGIKVKLLFDPPTNTSMVQALNEQLKELEVRMYTQEGGY